MIILPRTPSDAVDNMIELMEKRTSYKLSTEEKLELYNRIIESILKGGTRNDR